LNNLWASAESGSAASLGWARVSAFLKMIVRDLPEIQFSIAGSTRPAPADRRRFDRPGTEANRAEYGLLKELAGDQRNVFVVADDDQITPSDIRG
jgi:hypothetical protein